MDQLRREFDEYTRFLGQALELAPLDPEGRRQRAARRFEAALPLARPAARAQEAFEHYLQDLPHGAADLLAQRDRVALLLHVHHRLQRLAQAAHDTLLRERADLLQMGLSVKDALDLLLLHAELPPELRRRMDRTARALGRRADGAEGRDRPAAPAAPSPASPSPGARRRRKRS